MKTRHEWIGMGYDTIECEHCHVNQWDTSTIYCEDYVKAKLDKALKELSDAEELPKALTTARAALTQEQWRLLKIPYSY